jgi:Big-like domain-containing protein
MPRPLYRRPLVATCTAVLLGCGGADSTAPDSVATVVLFPASAVVEPTHTLLLSATLRDSRRLVVTGRTPSWSSSNPRVATVADGVVSGVSEGTATITATVDGQQGSASITVQRSIAKVEITPLAASLAVGSTVQLHAALIGSNGRPVEGPVVFWETSAPRVARVDQGKVRGLRVGSATITAFADDRRATTTVAVVPSVAGRWTVSYTLGDESGTTSCSGSGTLDLAQAGGSITGSFARTGRCATPTGPVDLAGRFELVDAAVSGAGLAFLAGCSFSGILGGAPPASAAGDLFCGPGLTGVALQGSWMMRR